MNAPPPPLPVHIACPRCGRAMMPRNDAAGLRTLSILRLAVFVRAHAGHGALFVAWPGASGRLLDGEQLEAFAAFVEGAQSAMPVAEQLRAEVATVRAEARGPYNALGALVGAVASLAAALSAFSTHAPLMGVLFLLGGCVVVGLNLQDRGGA